MKKYKYREKWTKIFDEDSDMGDGFQSKTMKQLDNIRANTIAKRKLNRKGIKKDGTFRKGWNEDRRKAELSKELKKVKKSLIKQRQLDLT